MKDKIFIKNLALPCKIGVTQEERSKKQKVIFDIEIFSDLSPAGKTDDIDQTIDYYSIKEKVTNRVAKGQFKLLESLAENVASLILKEPRVSSVTVAVKKEKYAQDPMLGIEIARDRNG